MARRDDYKDRVLTCVMCSKPIPPGRKWDAVTCSPECSKDRKNYGRSRKDQTQCRYCLRPSTPEERAHYHRWKKYEQSVVELLKEGVKRIEDFGGDWPKAQEMVKRLGFKDATTD